jgi:hypothetical protein
MKSKLNLSLALILVFLGISSCTSQPVDITPPAVSGKALIYEFDAANLRHLRTGEYYMLWLKSDTSSAWKRAAVFPETSLRQGDSTTIIRSISFTPRSAVVYSALVSVEIDTNSSVPTTSLISSSVPLNTTQKSFQLTTVGGSGVGGFNALSGVATFTTKSVDTTRAQHEFYLMTLLGATPSASLANLPTPPANWHYAVWVIDSGFVPHHLFFYGAFAEATGFDSDSTHDTYAFPGGYEPPMLAGTGGSITVTLEPDHFSGRLASVGPSPFNLLQGSLPAYISNRDILNLSNVSATGLPSGKLILTDN